MAGLFRRIEIRSFLALMTRSASLSRQGAAQRLSQIRDRRERTRRGRSEIGDNSLKKVKFPREMALDFVPPGLDFFPQKLGIGAHIVSCRSAPFANGERFMARDKPVHEP